MHPGCSNRSRNCVAGLILVTPATSDVDHTLKSVGLDVEVVVPGSEGLCVHGNFHHDGWSLHPRDIFAEVLRVCCFRMASILSPKTTVTLRKILNTGYRSFGTGQKKPRRGGVSGFFKICGLTYPASELTKSEYRQNQHHDQDGPPRHGWYWYSLDRFNSTLQDEKR